MCASLVRIFARDRTGPSVQVQDKQKFRFRRLQIFRAGIIGGTLTGYCLLLLRLICFPRAFGFYVFLPDVCVMFA